MQKTRRDMQRRTRRNASTIRGAASDSTIERADADRSGARPYHPRGSAMSRRLVGCFQSREPDGKSPIRRPAEPPIRLPRALRASSSPSRRVSHGGHGEARSFINFETMPLIWPRSIGMPLL